MPLERGYVRGRFGQVHLWDSGPGDGATTAGPDEPELFCLHATAYSGQTFLPLMHALGPGRRVVALDTPGYGGSDAPPARITVEDYAEALAEAIHASRRGERPVDLFGYHTGALLAAEIAVREPALVRRLVLVGIPYFAGPEREAWRQRLVQPTQLGESFDQFRERWLYLVEGRTPGLSLERAFACFVDELRAFPREWWAHAALFDYAAAERLLQLRAPVRVINLASALAGPSRDAAALMPDASVVDLPGVGGAPFDLGTAALAAAIEDFLR